MPNNAIGSLPAGMRQLKDVVDINNDGKVTRDDFGSEQEFNWFKDAANRMQLLEAGPMYLSTAEWQGRAALIDPEIDPQGQLRSWARELTGKEIAPQLCNQDSQVVVVEPGSAMHKQAVALQAKGADIAIVNKQQATKALMGLRAGYKEYPELAKIAESFLVEKVAPKEGWEPEIYDVSDQTAYWYAPTRFETDTRKVKDMIKIDFAIDTEDVGVVLDRRNGEIITAFYGRVAHDPAEYDE